MGDELPYVQYSKNNAYHSSIRATTNRVHFGMASADLSVSALRHLGLQVYSTSANLMKISGVF